MEEYSINMGVIEPLQKSDHKHEALLSRGTDLRPALLNKHDHKSSELNSVLLLVYKPSATLNAFIIFIFQLFFFFSFVFVHFKRALKYRDTPRYFTV